MLDAESVKKALDALISGDTEACAELLKGMIASAASGEAPAAETPAAPAAEATAEDKPAPEEPAPAEEKAAAVAASSRLTRLTGKTNLCDAVEEVEIWRTSHLKLEAESAKLAKERADLELGKRKENAVTLTKLGAETPHTTGLASESGKLCKRLLDEPLDEQNKRVAALLAAKGGKLPEAPKSPAGEASGLSAREEAMCVEMKIDPKEYAARKASKKAG